MDIDSECIKSIHSELFIILNSKLVPVLYGPIT